MGCPEGAEATDSSLAGSTHVLPVCKEAEPETANVLGRDEQTVLRRGAYDFARYGGSCCSNECQRRGHNTRQTYLRQAKGLPDVWLMQDHSQKTDNEK